MHNPRQFSEKFFNVGKITYQVRQNNIIKQVFNIVYRARLKILFSGWNFSAGPTLSFFRLYQPLNHNLILI